MGENTSTEGKIHPVTLVAIILGVMLIGMSIVLNMTINKIGNMGMQLRQEQNIGINPEKFRRNTDRQCVRVVLERRMDYDSLNGVYVVTKSIPIGEQKSVNCSSEPSKSSDSK